MSDTLFITKFLVTELSIFDKVKIIVVFICKISTGIWSKYHFDAQTNKYDT